MPLDTAAKRGSSIHVFSPWRTGIPIPDGTIGQGDRQHTAYIYSGILAAAAAATASAGWADVGLVLAVGWGDVGLVANVGIADIGIVTNVGIADTGIID